MKVASANYRCPLGRFIPDTVDKEQIKRDGWRDQGMVVVAVDDLRLDWMERELLTQIGNRLYGQRRRTS